MKKIIVALDDYLEKNRQEKAATTKAWREIHEAKIAADARGTDGAALIGEGWMQYEKACEIKNNESKFNAAADAAIAKISQGMSELELSCIEENEIENKALVLAKGNAQVREMHKYMAQPEPKRLGPYL